MASPLLGYNTNVRHRGKLFHIQTEDSGTKRAHIFTHLFADGGRIIASKKTTYAEHVEAENLSEIVRQLMKASHKAMFVALRDGLFDESEAEGRAKMAALVVTLPEELARYSVPPAISTSMLLPEEEEAPTVVVRPAAASSAPSQAAPEGAFEETLEGDAEEDPEEGSGRATLYDFTSPAAPIEPTPLPRTSIFGVETISEKSLDEVILSYLADELEDE